MVSISKNPEEEGFTIVELIVSILVAVILIASVNSIYTSHLVQSHQMRSMAVVTSFIENKVETLRSIGFLGLNDGTTNITSELPSDLMSPKSGSIVISSQASGLKKVVIGVSYFDGGKTRNYSYQTFIGELGVGQY
jgi:Tfp pilus assembly protein PilE